MSPLSREALQRILDRDLPGHRLAYPERHPCEQASEYRTWAVSRERVQEVLDREKPGWSLVRPEDFPSEAERAARERTEEEESSPESLLVQAAPRGRRGAGARGFLLDLSSGRIVGAQG